MQQQPIDLKALLSVPYVDPEGGFEISPDGKFVAFAWNPSGQWEIYELPLDHPAPPKQITHGPGGKFSPCYSPKGDRLAYVLDLDGGECFDIYIYDRVNDQHRNLTPGSPETIQPNLSWSPDGSQIAYISDRSGQFETYVMPASGGVARVVLAQPYPGWVVRWSPDGAWLLVIAETHGQDYGTFIVPSMGGEPRQISAGNEAINAKDSRWSPDSTRIAFSSDLHGYYDVGIYHLENDQIEWLTSGEGEKEAPYWSPDGKQLAYVIYRGPDSWLALQALNSDLPFTDQVEPGVHYSPRFTPDGKHLVFVFDNYRRPDDLWQLTLADGSLQQLTSSLPAGLQEVAFVKPQEVYYPSLDGTPVPALLFKPHGFNQPNAAVIVIHGGPTWLFQYLWYPIFQHMASRGWVVLAPNYRGSTGYGKVWQQANRFDLGGIDTKDVVAGVDYLVRTGLADSNRIAVSGRSHGGYLTMACLTQYPERWSVGSAVVPFLNWFTSHANSREDLQHWDIQNFGDPEKNRQLWHDRSPYFFLDRILSPVQLICGANDPRCPASESIAAKEKLLALGKEVDFVLYPDEGHAFLKINNVIDSEVRRVAFLAQVLEKTEGSR